MKKAISCVIFGISGRMGRELIESALRSANSERPIKVLAGIAGPDDSVIGQTLSGVTFPCAAEFKQEFAAADVIIDFSAPAGAMKALAAAKQYNLPLVSCTTGLEEPQEAEIRQAAESLPIVRARNTSLGVSVLAKLVREAAALLGEDYEIELVELHHRHKKDAPSGTAYLLLEEAAVGRNVELSDVLSLGRKGISEERDKSAIGAQAVRGGDVAGEHTVYFFGDGERIELTHRATKRSIFADGAMRAARWLAEEREAGLYSMIDVLERR